MKLYKMKKTNSVLLVLFLVFIMPANGQNLLKRVPKQYSLETGVVLTTKNTFEGENVIGSHLLFDYAWKLSGLHTDRGTYLSVPLGYQYYNAVNDVNKSYGVLIYGWTVRHELPWGGKLRPFVGYGLLFNQLRMGDIEGSVFGHETRFDVGCNYKLKGKFKLYLASSYSIARFPSLGTKSSDRFNRIALKIGVRFK